MKKSLVTLLHIVYWTIYSWLLAILLIRGDNYLNLNLVRDFFFNGPLGVICFVPSLIGFYVFYVVLFLKYLSKKNLIALVLSSILASVMAGLIGDLFLCIKWKSNTLFEMGWNSAIGITILMSFIAFVHGVFGLVMKGFITWYGDIKVKVELNKKNYEMELALMKAQINPHFLFNTINNIDVLIQKDPSKASEYLNKLSDIMRFMLYETKAEKIALEKELSYIEKYVELQKIRTTNLNYVKYEVKGSAGNLLIEPMLFIPFIENAFKHAENKKVENAIKISFVIEKDKIKFECENAYSADTQVKPEHSGLGNELIQRRLALLYANKHAFEVINKNGIYKVNLLLSL